MDPTVMLLVGLIVGGAIGAVSAGIAVQRALRERINAREQELASFRVSYEELATERERELQATEKEWREEVKNVERRRLEELREAERRRKEELSTAEGKAEERRIDELSVAEDRRKTDLANANEGAAKILRAARESAETQLKALRDQLEEQKRHEAQLEARLKDSFKVLADESLDVNKRKFLEETKTQVEPLEKINKELRAEIVQLENKREAAYAALTTQAEALGKETHSLNQLLSSPKLRGDWGEFHLTRVVELAGLKEYADFVTQVQGEDGRPDLVVRLPGKREVVVDAKVVLEAFKRYLAADSDIERKTALADHVKAIYSRIDNLASKEYTSQFQSLDFVVMYIPLDAAYYAALQADRDLFDYQAKKKVFIAGPVTLLSMLRSIAYSWRQHAMVQNATKIGELAEEFHTRLGRFSKQLNTIGTKLKSLVEAHGKAVGGFGRMLMPQARKLEAYIATENDKLIIEPKSVDEEIRILGDESSEGVDESPIPAHDVDDE